MRRRIFAANWKMHHAPAAAAAFARRFRELVPAVEGRSLWFFPPALSLPALVDGFQGRLDVSVGAQNVFWEPKGAFTGEISVPMIAEAGAAGALVGHSERRHVFGESDEATARKVLALLGAGLAPMLCVGETLAEREAGRTGDIVRRQLAAVLDTLGAEQLPRLLIAYEPVWAIGTGRVAQPADASEVHRLVRAEFADRGVTARIPVLYGGSVNPQNVAGLLAEDEIDGVLVGGASLEAEGWAAIVG